MLGSEYF